MVEISDPKRKSAISKLDEAEEALRESEARYRRLVETAPEVIYNLSAEDGTITLLNPAFERITGWSRDEWLGKPFLPLIHPDDLTLAMETFQRVSRGEATPPYELRILSKSGEYLVGEFTSFPHIEKGKVIGEYGFARDITKRKRAEAELIEREKFNFALFEYNPVETMVVDLEGKVIKSNLAKKKSGDRLPNIGDTMYKDYAGKHEIDMYAELMKCIGSGEQKDFPEQKYGDRVLSITIAPFPKGAVIISEDITERKRAEEETVRHAKNIESLSETAMGFVELPAEKDIYWFIGEKLRQLIDDAIYILVNSFDQKTGEIQVRALLADDRHRQAVSKSLGADPLGMSFVVSEEAWNGLSSGKLVRVPGGIHELSFGIIPKAACDALDKIARIGDIFTMGFARKGELYGSATLILREGYQLRNRDVVETLVRQAGVALQRKRAEEELRESRKQFQALTETTSDFVWELDANGVYTYCSPQINALWGYKAEDMIGKTPFDLMIPEDRELAIKMFRTMLESPGSFKGMETKSWDNTGRIVVLETSGVPFFDGDGRLRGYRGISRDITERKRAEEAVRKREEKYRSLTENVNLGIYRNTIGPEGKFIEANPAIVGMFGYESKEEFLAVNVSDLYRNPKDRNNFNKKILKEGFVKGEELQLKKKDGSLLVGSVSAVAVKDEQGRVKYYDGIIENITERKRAEEEIRKKNAELEAFVYMVSHDLKNPVVSIQGFCSLLMKNHIKDLSEKALFYIQRVQANAGLMTSLLEDLVELSRIGRVEDKKTEISVQEVIKSVWAGASASLATQNVEFVSPENLPKLCYSEKRLYQVFYNLLSNALKFRDEERKTRIEIGHREDKENDVFFVRDNGIGIEPKYHDKIFESFSQLKDIKSEGTGMGLAIVKKIVEANQGKVWVESRKGAGSTFYFTIPKNVKF